MSTDAPTFSRDQYEALVPFVTTDRLSPYLRTCGDDLEGAFALYEWNMRAASSVIELSSMVEVLVRNALDRELVSWARTRHGEASWFNVIPLDAQGREDIRKARLRASRQGRGAEVHGRVIAELSLGFWRFLVEPRYLTTLWIPSLHAAFPHGTPDLRDRQREVAFHLQQLNFVRNRAAHHEPIHRRDLAKDLGSALALAKWVSPTSGEWVAARRCLPATIRSRPSPQSER
jgi:hypothetical protein